MPIGGKLRRAGNIARNSRSLGAYLQARGRARARRTALINGEQAYSLRRQPEALADERDAVLAVTGTTAAEYERVLGEAWMPSPDAADTTSWDTRLPLLRILTAVANLLPLQTALEIGVERGFSSSVVLHAMASRGTGDLHSIDLPSAEADRRSFTGHVIPDHLLGRWSLMLGPSQH